MASNTGISISFDEITLVTHLTEGIGELIFIQATGFSYGDVPVQITPLACSDYEGDLEELFTDIPADSADPGKHACSVVCIGCDVLYICDNTGLKY